MNVAQGTYLIKEAFRTLKRHKGVTLISIFIMSLSLLMLAVFLLVTDNIFILMDRTKEEMKVYIYLEEDVSSAEIRRLHDRILSRREVSEIAFISKKEAMNEFREQMGEDSNLLDALEVNPLPASFRVKLKKEFKSKAGIEDFASEIEELEGVEDIRYGKAFLEKFSSISRAFLYVDAIVGLIVILSSVFIVSNTVRLTILSRIKTVEILKLCGATNRFITTPFLIEGAFQGGVAAVFSLVLLLAVFLASKRVFSDLSFFSPQKATLYVGACVFLGAMGSLASLRRFLKI